MITHDNEFVVDSNIVEYDVSGHFVFDLREPSERLDTDEKFISKNYGYFILNKSSGELKEGLEKAELEKIISLK